MEAGKARGYKPLHTYALVDAEGRQKLAAISRFRELGV
jgi:hypothetical protein